MKDNKEVLKEYEQILRQYRDLDIISAEDYEYELNKKKCELDIVSKRSEINAKLLDKERGGLGIG